MKNEQLQQLREELRAVGIPLSAPELGSVVRAVARQLRAQRDEPEPEPDDEAPQLIALRADVLLAEMALQEALPVNRRARADALAAAEHDYQRANLRAVKRMARNGGG